jgi:cell division protein ZapA
LSCGDGEEERLLELASHVRSKVEQLNEEFGRIGEGHALLMSAILIADELWDERDGKIRSPKKTDESNSAEVA